MANNLMSMAEVNRFAAYCVCHPGGDPSIEFDPHGPFR
jgi:hypothetical protein